MWTPITVYGATHDDKKDELLTEFPSVCSHLQIPYVVGGDFNILQDNCDKNKTMSRSPYVDKFNSIIHSFSLREIYMGGVYVDQQQKTPNFGKHDRVLTSFEWEDLFPLATVHKLVRDVSDHDLLLLSSRTKKPNTFHQREFSFKLSWFKDENCYSIAKWIWEQPVFAEDPIVKLKQITLKDGVPTLLVILEKRRKALKWSWKK